MKRVGTMAARYLNLSVGPMGDNVAASAYAAPMVYEETTRHAQPTRVVVMPSGHLQYNNQVMRQLYSVVAQVDRCPDHRLDQRWSAVWIGAMRSKIAVGTIAVMTGKTSIATGATGAKPARE